MPDDGPTLMVELAKILLPASLISYTFLRLNKAYGANLRRFTTAAHIPRHYFNGRTLTGVVLSVGDGDGLRLFHTP